MTEGVPGGHVYTMNLMLWIIAGLLAVAYLASGGGALAWSVRDE